MGLAVLALMQVPGLKGRLLFVALLFSAAGDVALGLENDDLFVLGLGFFLVTQVLYVVAFTRDFRWRRSRLPVVALVLAFAVAMSVFITPDLEDMALPVYVYITVITAMGVTAVLRMGSILVLTGALLFMVSDAMLAVNEFSTSIPSADYPIMVTYYLAQVLIVWGFLRDEPVV